MAQMNSNRIVLFDAKSLLLGGLLIGCGASIRPGEPSWAAGHIGTAAPRVNTLEIVDKSGTVVGGISATPLGAALYLASCDGAAKVSLSSQTLEGTPSALLRLETSQSEERFGLSALSTSGLNIQTPVGEQMSFPQ